MHRVLLVAAAITGLSLSSCSSFKNQRTPSGDFCSDMPVIPAGQDVDREYHRLQPISSDPKARTEAERLESLRKAACTVGGDAVIEAVNEEVRAENATYATVSSGTAVIWLRRNQGEVTPLKVHTTKLSTSGSPSATPAPDGEPAPTATEEPTSKPSATPSATPSAPPPPATTSKPSAPPPSTAKTSKPSAPPAPKKK
ncbi:MAG: hypothetical protein U0359_19645 [Byssovorax sp.]